MKPMSLELQEKMLAFIERVSLGSTLPDGINHNDDSLIECLGKVAQISYPAAVAVQGHIRHMAYTANDLYLAAVTERLVPALVPSSGPVHFGD